MDTVKQALKASLQGNDRYFENELTDEFEVVDEGDWIHECKWQSIHCVVRHIPTGRHFDVYQSRSGSYHTDWSYDQAELSVEVRRVTKTVTAEEWEAVE